MTIKIEVDISATPPSELIKLAKYMLECAGYTAVEQAPPAQVVPFTRDKPMGAYINDEPVTTITTDEKEAVGNVFALPQAPGIEVDAKGMPWDHRIHASSRAKVADGTWRQRRNLDNALLAQVEQELKQVMGLPAPAASEAQTVIPTAPTTPIEALGQAVAVPTPPPFVPSVVVPAAPVAIAPPPPSTPAGVATTAFPSSAPVTFPQLVTRITKMLAAKELQQADITAACASLGIPHMPALFLRPDLVPKMATALGIAL